MLELVWEDAGVARRMAPKNGLRIGRSSDNDIVLKDFSVSRHHAKIVGNGTEFRIVDLGSTNGLKVDGELLEDALLIPGSRIEVGSFSLRVEQPEGSDGGLSSTTYLRSVAEFNQDFGLEGEPSVAVAQEAGGRERVFGVLAQVAKTLLQVEELQPVLEKVMDVVFDHLAVHRGFIVLFDGAGEPRLELFRSKESEARTQPEVPLSRTILNMVTRRKVALLTHDAQTDQRFDAGLSIRMHQIRSAMCAPLWHRDMVIGVIYVDSPLHVGSFAARDLDLLTALANYAAVAIERARLNERIRREENLRRRLERYHSPGMIETVLADPDRVGPSVTARETTILFADIVGFTSRCESLSPEQVAAFLNQFFSRAAESVFEFGGTLDKFIGDAVMAFFGAPLSQPDHAERAVRAAISMMQAIQCWNRERASDGLEPVELRVGINTGAVVVGDIGSERRLDYTILGTPVNVAARLEETVADAGQIVLGEETQAAVAHLFPTEHLGNVQLRGLSREIAVYRVATEDIASENGDIA